jgi:hypothetical protein
MAGLVDGDVIRAPAMKTIPLSGFVALTGKSSVSLATTEGNPERCFDCELVRVAGLRSPRRIGGRAAIHSVFANVVTGKPPLA